MAASKERFQCQSLRMCNESIDCGCLEGAALWLFRRIDFDENRCACAVTPSIVAASNELRCGCFEKTISMKIIALCNESTDCECLDGASLCLHRKNDFGENRSVSATNPSAVAASEGLRCGCFEEAILMKTIVVVQ